MSCLRANASTQRWYSLVRWRSASFVIGYVPWTSRKKCTMCSGRVRSGMCPRMTMRSKQWYTNTTRLPNSLAKVSIGRLPVSSSQQRDHRSGGRWNQNFKYVWVGLDVPRSFEEAVLPHLDAAFNYARWLTKNDADAEDVVQDASVRALRFFSSLRGEDARARG